MNMENVVVTKSEIIEHLANEVETLTQNRNQLLIKLSILENSDELSESSKTITFFIGSLFSCLTNYVNFLKNETEVKDVESIWDNFENLTIYHLENNNYKAVFDELLSFLEKLALSRSLKPSKSEKSINSERHELEIMVQNLQGLMYEVEHHIGVFL